MPPNKLTSRKVISDSVYLRPWIKQLIHECYKHKNKKLQRPIYNAIPRLNKKDIENPESSRCILRNKRHFMRISKFYKVENYTIYATIKIARHNFLVEFTANCVAEFERLYRKRFTSETLMCLFVIGSCSVEYRTYEEIDNIYHIRTLRKNSNIYKKIPILVIDQAFIFDRTQVNQTEHVPFAYEYFL
ncbi:similar to Saccharomyces cerevisiae YIL009C-A EST3 Component of the telomerase holoenzyme, involved in telomere replication [Maudiozyma saulgeensis]|uniref:Telomere replication protein EST3 n=1 Tax=Maudiozyma saulgeensis TaxID=1789683 RepID=A0A1X7R347_9SACH|nr:similar to Saccharomyces cerevisiae YIL009C-A EST3 Component of the telomerase holoenzyme, involved in telomere replication [Kazachstania saulgeensis]